MSSLQTLSQVQPVPLWWTEPPSLLRPVHAPAASDRAGATYLGQLTHPFNTQAALQRHHFPDLVVDAFAPESPLCCRRASIFCKAPLKKSSSRVFSASTRLSWLTSLRRVDSREFCGGGHSLLSGGSY
jgi:hypothetical protein